MQFEWIEQWGCMGTYKVTIPKLQCGWSFERTLIQMHRCNRQGQHRLKPSKHYGTLKWGHMDIDTISIPKCQINWPSTSTYWLRQLGNDMEHLFKCKGATCWFSKVQTTVFLILSTCKYWNSCHHDTCHVQRCSFASEAIVTAGVKGDSQGTLEQQDPWELWQLPCVSSKTCSVHRCNRPDRHGPKLEFPQTYNLQFINISLLLTSMLT